MAPVAVTLYGPVAVTLILAVMAPVLQSKFAKPVPEAVSSSDPQKVVLLGVILTVGATVLPVTVVEDTAVQPLAAVAVTE